VGLKPFGARLKFLALAIPTTVAPTSIPYVFTVALFIPDAI